VNISGTRQDKFCVITLDALWLHSSSHAPCWTQATSWLGALARPVFAVVCVSNLLMLLETRAGLPSRPGMSWPMPSPSQHPPEKGKSKISMWHFLPITWRQKDVLVTAENGWLCSHCPCCLPCWHSPCGSCNLPQLPAFLRSHVCLKNCLLCLNCVCSSIHTAAVKSPLVYTQMSPCFSLYVLVVRSLGIPFVCSLSVPQQ